METQNHYSPMKQEMTKEEFRVIWQSIHLKATDKYAIPPEIIRVNGSTIGTLGNFSASAGKAKSKKAQKLTSPKKQRNPTKLPKMISLPTSRRTQVKRKPQSSRRKTVLQIKPIILPYPAEAAE